MNAKQPKPRRNLKFETLEERWTPAQFGIPWSDSMHLSLSFVPDGTVLKTETSQLHRTLDAQMGREAWTDAIIRAFNTWSQVANVNVGIVPDRGLPLGVGGANQGDARFGDIRVSGLPLADDAIAVSIPPSNATTGTFTGDLIINTRHIFDVDSLYSTVLHEAGHIFGLDHSTDRTSVMYSTLVGNETLNNGDIANIQSLYGAHSPDLNELKNPNNTLKDATRIRYSAVSGGYTGTTPVLAYGDISAPTDVDYFFVPGLPGYNGPISFRIQTAGVSSLAPKVTLLAPNGRVLATRTSVGSSGSVTKLTLSTSTPDAKYYLRIEAAPNAQFKTGRFGIAVTFDGRLQPTAIPVNTALMKPYEQIDPEKIDQLFKDPKAFLEEDLHLNDSLATAQNLRIGSGQLSAREFGLLASISDTTDVDVYRLRAPDAVTNVNTWFLTLSVRGEGSKAIVPKIELLDANSVAIPTEVIVNGNGQLAVQAQGLQPRRSYYVRLSSPGKTGNYDFNASFSPVGAELESFASASFSSAGYNAQSTLYVARSQLFSFLLTSVSGNASVTMTITDLNGNVIHRQTALRGQSASQFSTLLTPGEYRVTFSSASSGSFLLRGSRITDPIGPIYQTPIFKPQYQPNLSTPIYVYPYPLNTPSTKPYAMTTPKP